MDYKCLNKQEFNYQDCSIVPIRYEDRFLIMKWRNEQIFHLRQLKPLTEDDQENYFRNIVSKLYDQDRPDQVLFSYLQFGECIGYGGLVHINWTDRNAEISFIINPDLEKNGGFALHWTNFLTMLKKVAFEELELHKIYTYAFDLRPHLYPVVESNGFLKEAVLKDHCLYGGVFRDVIIHSFFQ